MDWGRAVIDVLTVVHLPILIASVARRRADGSPEGQDAAVSGLVHDSRPPAGRAPNFRIKAGSASFLLFGAPMSTAWRLGQSRNGHQNQMTSVYHPDTGSLRNSRVHHSR